MTSLAVQSEQLATLLLLILNALNGDPPHLPQRFNKLNLACATNIRYPGRVTGLTNGAHAPFPNPYPRHLIYPRSPPTPLRATSFAPGPEQQFPQLPLLKVEHGGANRIDNEKLELECGKTGPLTEPCVNANETSKLPYPLPAIGKHR